MLYIVSTPIGNLKDITLRAIETLQSVDSIICEDTRRTSILLNHYNIKKPLLILNDFNETKTFNSIVNRLKSGENLALISDAGTPLISDPGYKLVRSCLENGIEVDSIPGSSSVIIALTLSGLPPDKFLFLGYPPEKPGHRKSWLENLLTTFRHPELVSGSKKMLKQVQHDKSITIIIFISPHKLLRFLEEMKEILGNIEIVLAHELTKIHQSVEKENISDWLETLNPPAGGPRGEYVLLFRL